MTSVTNLLHHLLRTVLLPLRQYFPARHGWQFFTSLTYVLLHVSSLYQGRAFTDNICYKPVIPFAAQCFTTTRQYFPARHSWQNFYQPDMLLYAVVLLPPRQYFSFRLKAALAICSTVGVSAAPFHQAFAQGILPVSGPAGTSSQNRFSVFWVSVNTVFVPSRKRLEFYW